MFWLSENVSLPANSPGSYDYILVNDDLDRTYDEFKNIIHKVNIQYCL